MCGEEKKETNEYVNGCGHRHSRVKKGSLKITLIPPPQNDNDDVAIDNRNTELLPEQAIELMSRISDESSEFLGFNHT